MDARDELVYPKTGSHWSEYGAFVGYRALMARITESLPVRRLTAREVHLSFERRAGDLGRKFDPPIVSRYVYVDVIEPRARLVHDNRVRNHGRLVEFQADTYNELTCLVFGDSYAVRLMPLIAEAFHKSYWAHAYFDYELIRELQPDVVVSVVSERSMIIVQSDTEPGLRRLEAQKRETGDVMPPRVTQVVAHQQPPHVTRAIGGGRGRRPAGVVSDDQSAEALDLPGSIRDGKVIEGRNGRLFLANDANRVLDQHSGDLRLAEDKLRQWRHLLETRTAWLERRGSRHYFLIAPDAHSVYPESLPAGLPVAPERPVHQLLAHLREHESYARVVYPLEQMVATATSTPSRRPAPTGRSRGAFACRALAEEIRRDVPIEPVALDAYELVELDYAGDLGAKVDPVAWSTFIRADPRAARSSCCATTACATPAAASSTRATSSGAAAPAWSTATRLRARHPLPRRELPRD